MSDQLPAMIMRKVEDDTTRVIIESDGECYESDPLDIEDLQKLAETIAEVAGHHVEFDEDNP